MRLEHGVVESYDPVAKKGQILAENGDLVEFRLADRRNVKPAYAALRFYGSLDRVSAGLIFFPERTDGFGLPEVVVELKKGDLLVFMRKKWPFMRPFAKPWGPGKEGLVHYPNYFGERGGHSGRPH